jgi:hypothetical protein
MSKETLEGNDVVNSTLSRIGINRSMLITLALLPWAWDGVSWLSNAARALWDLISGVGS